MTTDTVTKATAAELADALHIERDGDDLVGHVREGWDVFSIPHGGYLAALAANAALTVSGAPDLFTLTVHYLRKAATGPMRFAAQRVGGSRRFASWALTGSQDGEPVLTALVSVGDRTSITGPSWTDRPAWHASEDAFTPPAGDPAQEAVFATPAIAQRMAQQLVTETAGFARGRTGEHAVLRSRVLLDEPDQLAAIVACDVTPPAVWNVLGARGWVPTVELTVHLRGRPAAGPLSVEATTHHVADGFLEEDALVHDAGGRLVAQSRQLARMPQAG